MATMSNYLAAALIKYTFQGVAFTPANPLYVELNTASNSASAAGTEVTTTQLTGYARQSIATTTSGWTYGANAVSNTNVLTYTTNAATSSSLPTITGYYVNDASSGAGNLYVYDNFGSSVTPASGNTVQFNAAGLTVTAS